MRKSVIECVSKHAKTTPDKVAVVVNGSETTYKELYDLACGYSKYLQDKGLEKGDIVVVKANQSLDYVMIYLGIHLGGG